MAYDSFRHFGVLFGGVNLLGDFLRDTWEWDGENWVLRSVTGPSARFKHALVYESARRTTLLFGGEADGVKSGETWRWTGSAWTRLSTTGPAARFAHAMAYDAGRNRTVLFGGVVGNAANAETWEWNGSAWTQRSVTGPLARHRHAMAYDSARGVTVLFGGISGSTAYSDTWEWNGTSWTQISASGPGTLVDHSMVFDTLRNRVVMFGGVGVGGQQNLIWEWDGQSWVQRTVPANVSRRSGAAMAFDSDRGVSVLAGGLVSGEPTGELWELGASGWTQKSDTVEARNAARMVYDSAHQNMTMFGGYVTRGTATWETFAMADTWTWNNAWRELSVTGPHARAAFGMAFDSARGVTVMHGGVWNDGSQVFSLSDTWEFDGSVWTQRATVGPSSFGTSVYDSRRGVVVAVNGAQTWEWNGAVWTNRQLTGPPARSSYGVVFDSNRGVSVYFGGVTSTPQTLYDETWEYDGNAWTQRSLVFKPVGRSNFGMSYDSVSRLTILFGGAIMFPNGLSGPTDDTWSYDGVRWSRQPVTSNPSARVAHSLAFDPVRGQTIMFGGSISGGTKIREMWALTSPCANPTVAISPENLPTCPDGVATFEATATGGSAPVYTWSWRPAGAFVGWSPIVNGPNSDSSGIVRFDASGATTSSISLSRHTGSQGDLGVIVNLKCSVANACGIGDSNQANIHVCASDFNCDGGSDFFDYLDFVAAFSQIAPEADFNRDGAIDFFDYLDFVERFSAGC